MDDIVQQRAEKKGKGTGTQSETKRPEQLLGDFWALKGFIMKIWKKKIYN